jgi:hypothetical protein
LVVASGPLSALAAFVSAVVPVFAVFDVLAGPPHPMDMIAKVKIVIINIDTDRIIFPL